MAGLFVYARPGKFARNDRSKWSWDSACPRGRGQAEIDLPTFVHEVVGRHRVGKAGWAQARAGVELIAVPGAFEIAVAHDALAEGAVLMRADIGDGVERAVLADDCHALAVDVHRDGAPFGKIREGAEEDEAVRARRRRPVAAG